METIFTHSKMFNLIRKNSIISRWSDTFLLLYSIALKKHTQKWDKLCNQSKVWKIFLCSFERSDPKQAWNYYGYIKVKWESALDGIKQCQEKSKWTWSVSLGPLERIILTLCCFFFLSFLCVLVLSEKSGTVVDWLLTPAVLWQLKEKEALQEVPKYS